MNLKPQPPSDAEVAQRIRGCVVFLLIALLKYLRSSHEEWQAAPSELRARGSSVMSLLENIDALREVEAEDRTKGNGAA